MQPTFPMSLDDELAIEQEIFACRVRDQCVPSYVFSPDPSIETRNDFEQWGYFQEHESFSSSSCDDFLNKRFQGRLSICQLEQVLSAIGVESGPLVGAFYYMDKISSIFPRKLHGLISDYDESTVVAMFTAIAAKFIDDEIFTNDVMATRMGFSSLRDFNLLEKKVFCLMNCDAYIPPDQYDAYRTQFGLRLSPS